MTRQKSKGESLNMPSNPDIVPDMATLPGGVYRHSVRRGTWYVITVAGQKVLQVGTFFVLARLLLPEHYGIMSAVLVVTSLLNVVTTIPFSDAIIYTKERIDEYMDPFWTIDLLRLSVLTLGVWISGPFLAHFFHIEDASSILLMRLSGLMLLIPALSNVRFIALYKTLDFKKFFFRDISTQLTFSLTAILFAVFVQRSAWALFAGYLAQGVAGIVASYLLHPHAPRLSFSFAPLKKLLGYTKWVYGQDVMETLTSQADKLVVGGLLNPTQLGIYSKAKDLAGSTTALVISLISRVGFPAFSLIQDNLEKVRQGLLKTLDVLLMTSLVWSLLFVLEGGAIVEAFLGTGWLAIVVPLKIFAVGNIFRAFTATTAPVLNGLGRPEVTFKTNTIQTVCTIPLMYVGFHFFGWYGLAIAVVTVWAVMLTYAIFQIQRILRVPLRPVAATCAAGLLACAMTVFTDLLLRASLPDMHGILLLLSPSILFIVYMGSLLAASRWMGTGPYRTLFSVLWEIGITPRQIRLRSGNDEA